MHQVINLILWTFSYLTSCRSDTFIDVTGVETATSFSANTSYKIVDDTDLTVSDISDTETSTSSPEQSCDR